MIRNQDIFYGDAIRLIQKRDPDYTEGLRLTGWVPSPEHEVDSTYTRQKEIRSFYDGKYGYIYNNCYREDALEISPIGVIVPYGGGRMRATAAKDQAVGERYRHYLLRAQEELYDWSVDPGGWNNLAEDPDYAEVLQKARAGLLQWMKDNKDPLAVEFENNIHKK
jgi:hypothetical protein